jgi:Septum formation
MAATAPRPTSRPQRRSRPVLVLGLALVLFGAGCGDDEASSPFDVEVGDCFDTPAAEDSEVSQLVTLSCDEPHDNEAYFLFDLDDNGGDFPGAAAIDEEGVERCSSEFEDYVGSPPEESSLTGAPLLTPSEESWEDGDREVVCVVFTTDGDPLDRPVRDSGL